MLKKDLFELLEVYLLTGIWYDCGLKLFYKINGFAVRKLLKEQVFR